MDGAWGLDEERQAVEVKMGPGRVLDDGAWHLQKEARCLLFGAFLKLDLEVKGLF